MVALAEPHNAAREPTTAVAMVQGPSKGWWDRAGPGRYLDDPTISAVLHHHPARVTRQAPRRFRGNVRAVLEHGLAGRLGVGKHRSIDVDHDLIAPAWCAPIDTVMKRCFAEQHESVRLLLLEGGRFRGNVTWVVESLARLLIQAIPCGG
jgi:hypothetical protein